MEFSFGGIQGKQNVYLIDQIQSIRWRLDSRIGKVIRQVAGHSSVFSQEERFPSSPKGPRPAVGPTWRLWHWEDGLHVFLKESRTLSRCVHKRTAACDGHFRTKELCMCVC